MTKDLICPKCCDVYRFKEILYQPEENTFICVFNCQCEEGTRIDEEELMRMNSFLLSEEEMDRIRDKKIDLIKKLLRERLPPEKGIQKPRS